MRDRTGFFAACADSLTDICAYYAVAGLLIMSGRGWGLHLFWLMLWSAACLLVFELLLKKPRSMSLLTVVTAALGLAGFGLFVLASKTPLRFGYGLVLAVGAGMAVGLPLNYTLHRPKVMAHLTHLDVHIVVLLFFMLTKDALGLDGFTLALAAAVLFMDAAAAVGLRMSDGDSSQSGSAFKASMVALASAVLLALVILLFVMLFSRSGAVTGSVLQGVGAFLAFIGGGIESVFRWLSSLIHHRDTFDAIDLPADMPSLAEAELAGETGLIPVNTTAISIGLCAVLAVLVIAAALLLRRRRAVREDVLLTAAPEADILRTGGTAALLWQRLRQALRFYWTAFVLKRDTPAGLLALLERKGRRLHVPRTAGESMRAFIDRMDPDGGLTELSDALDRQYYSGDGTAALEPGRCRQLRRYIRKAVGHD